MRNPILSARDALYIAAQHGLSIRSSRQHKKLIRERIIAAREAQVRSFPRKSAVRHFDESMMVLAQTVIVLML